MKAVVSSFLPNVLQQLHCVLSDLGVLGLTSLYELPMESDRGRWGKLRTPHHRTLAAQFVHSLS